MKRLLLSLVSVLLLAGTVLYVSDGPTLAETRELHSIANDVVVLADKMIAESRSAREADAQGTIALNFGNALTITVTAAQHAKLTRLLTDSNTARVANGQAAQTLEEWLRDKLVETVQREINIAESHEQAEACQAFKGLSTNAQNQIKAALGDKSPCR